MAAGLLLSGSDVSAKTYSYYDQKKSCSKAMVVGEDTAFGRATVHAYSTSSNASTTFGTNQVTATVNATCYHANAKGQISDNNKKMTQKMVATVSFSYTKITGQESTHKASTSTQKADNVFIEVLP